MGAIEPGVIGGPPQGGLLTGSYMDYAMPRADDVPSFKVGTKVTPCTHNPLGAKGCGEAGPEGRVPDAWVSADAPSHRIDRGLQGGTDMYAFELTRAKTVADAAAALGKSGGKALAGGQSLVGAMKLRLAQPGTLVDLSGITELRGIKKEPDAIVIGAMTRHAEVAASAAVKGAIPALTALAQGIGDRQVRNMGTLGGSIAHNDPAADWPAAVLGLGASVVTSKRKISADDFFRGMYETALAADELITAVTFPVPKKAAYAKFPNPASRFALVGVFVAQTVGGVRVAVTGAAPAVFRSKALEVALGKSFTAAAAKSVKIDAKGLNGDLHGSPEYRAHLIAVLASRAVAAAG